MLIDLLSHGESWKPSICCWGDHFLGYSKNSIFEPHTYFWSQRVFTKVSSIWNLSFHPSFPLPNSLKCKRINRTILAQKLLFISFIGKQIHNLHWHQREHPREMNMRIEYENRSHENNKREFLFHIIYICKFCFYVFMFTAHFHVLIYETTERKKKFFFARKNWIYIFSCNSFIHSFWLLFCFFFWSLSFLSPRFMWWK